jgi:aryl-alcohol dehydrogenase-like predicted oxidoreductase
MKYRTIGSDPATQRSVSVLSLGAMLMGSRTGEETSFAILDREVPVIPLVGASSVAQLDESLAAVDLELSEAQRARLDGRTDGCHAAGLAGVLRRRAWPVCSGGRLSVSSTARLSATA